MPSPHLPEEEKYSPLLRRVIAVPPLRPSQFFPLMNSTPLFLPKIFSLHPLYFFSAATHPNPSLKRNTITNLHNLLKTGRNPTTKSINYFLLFLLKSHKPQLTHRVSSQFSSYSNARTNYIVAHALLRSHRFEDAQLFMNHHQRSELLAKTRLWEGLIRGICIVERNPLKSLAILKDCVRNRGLVVSARAFRTLVLGFCNLGDVDGVVKVVELMEDNKEDGRWLLHRRGCKAVISAGIDGLCRHGSVDKAIAYFGEILGKGLVANSAEYTKIILRGLQNLNVDDEEDREKGVLKLIHLTEEFEPEFEDECWMIYNDCVVFLSKSGCVDAGLHILLLMKQKGLGVGSKSYYITLKKLIQTPMKDDQDCVKLVLNLFIKDHGMFEEQRVVDVVSLYLCKLNMGRGCRFVPYMGAKRKISLDATTAIVGSLKQTERSEEAHKLAVEAEDDEGFEMDVVAYSIVVDGLCKEGHLDKALEVCEMMKKRGTHPNMVTYNSILNGLCLQGCLVEAFRLFNSLDHQLNHQLNHQLTPTIVTYGTLIDALSREGFLEDAHQLFEKLVGNNLAPDTHIYNSLIYGHCSFGMVTEGLKYLHDLELKCLQPDAFTISSLLGGFYVKGDMEGALVFYDEYKKKEVAPDFLGFTCLIKGLCVKGRMEEARGILRDMLQCQPVLTIIKRAAGDGIDVGSLARTLDDLCGKGSIEDAMNLLSEIGYFSFPSAARFRRVITEDGNPNVNVNPAVHVVNELGNVEDGKQLEAVLPTHDFEAYYSRIESLCSKGEFKWAKSVVKTMLDSYRHL